MNELKHLQGILNNDDFLRMDTQKQKEYVFDSLELDLYQKLNSLGVKVKMSYDAVDVYKFIAERGNEEFLSNLHKTLIKIMSVMQNQEIILKKGNRRTSKAGLTAATFARLTERPLISYNVEGKLLSIEYSDKMDIVAIAYDLINQFENRFLVPIDLNQNRRKLNM